MSSEQIQQALRHLDKLLGVIYSGHFDKLTRYIDEAEAAENQEQIQ